MCYKKTKTIKIIYFFVCRWDQKFCNVHYTTIFEMINASNFLEIKPLLDLNCKIVAGMIKDKSKEEMRIMFVSLSFPIKIILFCTFLFFFLFYETKRISKMILHQKKKRKLIWKTVGVKNKIENFSKFSYPVILDRNKRLFRVF